MENRNKILNLSVLVVEDEEVMRNTLVASLKKIVKTVWSAPNGKEGLELFKEHFPDVIVTDISMPKMSGIEMLKEIIKLNTQTYRIIVSAHGDKNYLLEAIEIGIDKFLPKPISLKALQAILTRHHERLCMQEEFKKQSKVLAEYKRAVDASNIVSKTDLTGHITFVNEEFCKTSGYTKEELLGQSHNIVRRKNMPRSAFKELWETILAKNIWKGVVENRRKDGSSYFVDATVTPILDNDGNIVEFLAIRHDITEFINSKKALYTNSLTGLPNRNKLITDLQNTQDALVAIVNIDSFRELNDFFGHNVGDFVLIEFGQRLNAALLNTNIDLYKLPSDEYALVSTASNKETFVEKVTNTVNFCCQKSMQLGEYELLVRASIGFAQGAQRALADANMALKSAKTKRLAWSFYDESMNISKIYEKNIICGEKLHHAIVMDKLVPYFQPIIDNATGKITKYECLIRLIDDDGSVISPYFFLDVAKKSRLYPHITKAVVTKAFEVFKDKDCSFSINLSVDDIMSDETRRFLRFMLLKYKNAHKVIFEILESEGIENYPLVNEFVSEVKSLGCKIAIDDFGTGYSNFEHILKLNVDFIKIDGSLIKNIHTDTNIQIIVETIVGFAKKLGIGTIAEFVHNEEVKNKICELGVDSSQGYYIGEPLAHTLD